MSVVTWSRRFANNLRAAFKPERPTSPPSLQDRAVECGAELEDDCRALPAGAKTLFLPRDVTRRREAFAEILLKGPKSMDCDQLGQLIRFYSHGLDKATKCLNTRKDRGYDRYVVLREALQEWRERGYESGPDKKWAERALKRYETWRAGKQKLVEGLSEDATNRPTDVFSVIKDRRSVRFWKKRRVEPEIIEAMIDAAMHAPCSCNRMAWKFIVVENDWNDLTTGNSSNPSLVRKAPLRIYVGVDERLYPQVYAPAIDAGLAVQNLCLAAHALGLGACVVYQAEAVRQADLRREFGVPACVNIYCVVLIGYPDESPSKPGRPAPAEIYNVVKAKPGTGAFFG